MKKIENLRQLQQVGIYIYKELLRVCNEIGVNLYLHGGTLIGAIRHKGFIPWDDDIDLCISRPDYEKLLSKTHGRIGDKCFIIDPATDKSYKGIVPVCVYENSYVKSLQFKEDERLKISCSIFVYDGVPNGKIKRFFYFKRMYLLRAKHALCRANFKFVNTKTARIIGPLLSPFFKAKDVYKYKNKILDFQRKYKYEDSEFVSTNADSDSQKEVFPRSSFEKSVSVEFENIPSKTYSYYHEHLTRYYGDYMTPPPVEKQKPKHGFYAEIDDSFEFDRA